MQADRNFSEIITLDQAHKKDGRRLLPKDLGLLKNASVVYDENEIFWVGEDKDFPDEFKSVKSNDKSGTCLTPEIVDSHTHLVFGGDRAFEYALRLNGADYEEIALNGGGILSTMKNTNELSSDELFELGKKRCLDLYSYGVGSIEIKSGYALNFEKEYEISHVIDRLKKELFPKIQIKNTFMAAHAIPRDFKSSGEYINSVVIPLLEKLSKENIIDAVDIFHEKGYFNTNDVLTLFAKSKNLGIDVKIHADEFYDNKGALLACEQKALSCDHLLCTGDDGIKALSESETVATLLPGTGLFLGKEQANARKFLDSGVKVAIASDFNPGSCHFDNLLMIASISAPLYKMNLAELWSAITLNSAHALGLKTQGALKKGLAPRFSCFNTDEISKISYHWGKNLSANKKIN